MTLTGREPKAATNQCLRQFDAGCFWAGDGLESASLSWLYPTSRRKYLMDTWAIVDYYPSPGCRACESVIRSDMPEIEKAPRIPVTLVTFAAFFENRGRAATLENHRLLELSRLLEGLPMLKPSVFRAFEDDRAEQRKERLQSRFPILDKQRLSGIVKRARNKRRRCGGERWWQGNRRVGSWRTRVVRCRPQTAAWPVRNREVETEIAGSRSKHSRRSC